MRKILLGLAALAVTSAAHPQTTTTNCTAVGYGVQCTSRTQPTLEQNQQQNQENNNRAFQNLGAAIAADREKRRGERAAESAAAAQSEIDTQVEAALATEQPASPPPTDESPALLACTVNNEPFSIALYEKHGRADVTSGGVARTRAATFNTDAVTWTSPVVRSAINRLDGSYVGYSNIPALQGQIVWRGSCTVARERKF